jgi:hypothetical protein
MTPALAHVHVRQMPVQLWQQSQEHHAELVREFMLISSDVQHDASHHQVPQQLLRLIDEVTTRFSGFGEANEQLLVTAAADGLESIDLDYDMPAEVSGAARQLGEMLDQADDFCRRGEHLLTLATPPEQVRFRRWFLDEIVRQVEGNAPTPWPDYKGD